MWARSITALGLMAGLVLLPTPASSEILDRAPTTQAIVPAPGSVTATPLVAGLEATWQPPAEVEGITGFRVSTDEGFTVEVGPDVRSTVVEVLAPASDVVVSVRALQGTEESFPSVVSARALAPGGAVRVLPAPVRAGSFPGLRAGATRAIVLAGRHGVPTRGVGSVSLLVTASRATMPTTLYVGSGTRAATPAMGLARGATRAQMVQVPMSAGRVSVRHSAGSAAVVVHVVAFTLASAGPTAVGTVRPVPAHQVLAPRVLARGASRDVVVAGAGGVPAAGVAAVQLTVRSAAASRTTRLGLGPSGAAPRVAQLVARSRTVESQSVWVPVRNGKVRLANFGPGSTTASASVTAWTAADDDQHRLGANWLVDAPDRSLVASRLVRPGSPYVIDVRGRAGVPSATASSPATGVLLAVSARGVGSRPAGLAVAPADAASVLPVSTSNARALSTGTIVVPVPPDGRIALATSGSPASVTATVLGFTVGRPLLTSTAVVLSGSELDKFAPYTPGDTSMSVSRPTTSPRAGSVLVAPPTTKYPYGLFVRVVDAVESNGTWDLTVEPARLQDAVRNGSVSTMRSLGEPVETLTPPDPGVTGAPSTGQGAQRRRGFETGLTKTVTRSGSYDDENGATGSYSFTATARFEAEADIDIDIGWGGVKAKVSVGAEESVDAQIDVEGHAIHTSDVELGRYRFATFVVQIGPVPVVITPEVALGYHTDFSADASATVSFHQAASGEVGVRYDDGVHPIKEFTDDPPTFSVDEFEATVSASAGITGEAALAFWGGVSHARAGLDFTISSHYGYPSCYIDTTATLTGSVGADIAIPLAEDLSINESFTLADWDLPKVRVPFGTEGCDYSGVIEIQGDAAITQYDKVTGDEVYRESDSGTARFRFVVDPLRGVGVRVEVDGTNTVISSGTEGCFGDVARMSGGVGPYSRPVQLPPLQWGMVTKVRAQGGTHGPTPSCVYFEPEQINEFGIGGPSTGSLLANWLGEQMPSVVSDVRTIAFTLSPSVAELCAWHPSGLCPDSESYRSVPTGGYVVAVRLTNRPDADSDGIPDVDDPTPRRFTGL